MKTRDFLEQKLSEKKLFGCTIDDITDVVVEIMDNHHGKLIRKLESVLDYASGGNVSKYDTDIERIKVEIDNFQGEHHYGIMKDDLLKILEKPDCTLLDIMDYVNKI